MKRLVMALMAFVFLMSVVFVLPACAETVFRDGIEVTLMTDKESYDSMEASYFYGGQTLKVYNGPSWKYSRAANGKAMVTTDEEIAVAGIENGYALVMYETKSGYRSGYAKIAHKMPSNLCNTNCKTELR